jgi:hypothetical protein
MANNPKRIAAAANAACDAWAALLNGGSIEIRSGTKPADPTVAPPDGALLATLTLGNPAFGAAANGVATANAITGDSSADATGTASWFRAKKSDATALLDGTVGTAGCDLNLGSVALQAGAQVSITSFTLTEVM